MQPFLVEGPRPFWILIRDGNESAMQIFLRHYTAKQTRKVYQFIGPGEKMALLWSDANALFGWRKFIDHCIDQRTGQQQQGVNCCVFRNESGEVSSYLIGEAVKEARRRWPTDRLYTYVDPREVKPVLVHGVPCFGFCFRQAGWKFCGITQDRKFIWEMGA